MLFYSSPGAQVKSDGEYPSNLVGRAGGKILAQLQSVGVFHWLHQNRDFILNLYSKNRVPECNIVVVQRTVDRTQKGHKHSTKKAKIILHNTRKWHEFAFQVNISVESIVVQSLNGMRTLLNGSDVLRLPMILNELCINVVLGVGMTVLFLLMFDGKHVCIKSLLSHKLQRCEKGLARLPCIWHLPSKCDRRNTDFGIKGSVLQQNNNYMQHNMETGWNPFLLWLCVYDIRDNKMSLDSPLCLEDVDFRHSGDRDRGTHSAHHLSF